ncbi:hypothetical protein Slin_0186 [Spirosoma linguale DSM 74]|uniref:SD-repeat containing protein B domain-containing protein n=1 Tax=Spirosoma linguale (strain ATCC 33905 / DSM 74 / LMG 10896 / Claus 1) TaxID=504472 RepID=D2QCE0_SPILD|nr:hypothetical protein Slin_0186 [Spirosoma linguale DSM 74]
MGLSGNGHLGWLLLKKTVKQIRWLVSTLIRFQSKRPRLYLSAQGRGTESGWLARPKGLFSADKLPVAFLAMVMGFLSVSAFGQTISGTVYFDGNNDGIRNTKEIGFGGVVVKAYDPSNTLVASTTSNLSSGTGAYTLSGLTNGTVYRVEFTLPSGYNYGAKGSASNTSVQFVKSFSGSIADFGVYTTGVCDPDGKIRVVTGCNQVGDTPETSVASWYYLEDRVQTIPSAATTRTDMDVQGQSDLGIPLGMGSRKINSCFGRPYEHRLLTDFPNLLTALRRSM